MKKLIFLLSISFSLSVNASNETNVCAKDEYPDLHTSAYLPDETIGGKKVSHVVQTIPFTKVSYAGRGAMYHVIHPNPSNECNEISTLVADDDSELIGRIMDMIVKYPNAAKKSDITLVLTYVNGKTDGVWKVHAIGYPNNPENE